MKSMRRSVRLAVTAAATALAIAGGCSGHARVSENPPSDRVLRRLCEESYQTTHDQLAAAGELASAEGGYFYTEGEGSVVCSGGAWTVELDGSREVGLEMDLVFYAEANAAEPVGDYCDIGVGYPVDAFEERQFDGHRFCFWWWHGGVHHTGTATYIDRSTTVILQWHIDSRDDPFDEGIDIGSLFFATNDAVLAGIYEGFSQE